jgi:integrase
MAKRRFTARWLESLKAPKNGQVEYFDTDVRSFGLRASYGGKLSWFVMGRCNGKLIRSFFGECPIMSLADAREVARQHKKKMGQGIDPRRKAEAERAAAADAALATFETVADNFLEQWVEPTLRTATAKAYRFALKGKDTEAWHKLPIADLTGQQIMSKIKGMIAKGNYPKARLIFALLKRFFAWAVEEGHIKVSPLDRMKMPDKPKAKEGQSSREHPKRKLPLDELRKVWAAAEALGSPGGSLVQMLVLCGQRRQETALMEWTHLDNLDGKDPAWRLPAKNTKNGRAHTVPLSPQAVAVIKAQPHFAGSPYVFSRGQVAFSTFAQAKRELDSLIARRNRGERLPPWAFHDLRRTFVSQVIELGITTPWVADAIVNHVSEFKGGVQGRYNLADHMSDRRAALLAWGRVVTGEDVESNIIPLRASA